MKPELNAASKGRELGNGDFTLLGPDAEGLALTGVERHPGGGRIDPGDTRRQVAGGGSKLGGVDGVAHEAAWPLWPAARRLHQEERVTPKA